MSLVALLLCALASLASGHFYWINTAGQPSPRIDFCSASQCTSASPGSPTSGLQGPIWLLTASAISGSSGINGDTITAVSCGTLAGAANYSGGAGYSNAYTNGGPSDATLNPLTANGAITTVWKAGSVQSLTFWINQVHPGLVNIAPSSDGWQIRYRDAAAGGNFQVLPISFTYTSASSGTITQYTAANDKAACVKGKNTYCTGPFETDSFPLGITVTSSFVVPSVITSDLELQVFWTLSGLVLAPGIQASWMSCTDVMVSAASNSIFGLAVVSFSLLVSLLS